MALERVHLKVSGRVQGVGFRLSTSAIARELGMAGWVKNLSTGEVEIDAGGPPDAVGEFLEWVAQGPAGARVERVEVLVREPVAKLSWKGFEIR